jgi:hypothetical protein
MGSSDLPNTALLGENRLDDERCELHPDTSQSVSTMSREMRPLSPELRHPLRHKRLTTRTSFDDALAPLSSTSPPRVAPDRRRPNR